MVKTRHMENQGALSFTTPKDHEEALRDDYDWVCGIFGLSTKQEDIQDLCHLAVGRF